MKPLKVFINIPSIIIKLKENSEFFSLIEEIKKIKLETEVLFA